MYLFVDYKFSSSSFSGSFSGQVDSAAALDAYLAWPFFGPEFASWSSREDSETNKVSSNKFLNVTSQCLLEPCEAATFFAVLCLGCEFVELVLEDLINRTLSGLFFFSIKSIFDCTKAVFSNVNSNDGMHTRHVVFVEELINRTLSGLFLCSIKSIFDWTKSSVFQWYS
jgi:hypothetical protein